ncbi:DNA polymerase [Hylemonella gracilis]|uniref:DNA polymerase n=1 Tax=Hylemonella gracilis TaxID=80880 RepID=UPI0018CC7AC8|nr:DNA polymerase [Hylemonella gracilis]
MNDFTGRGEERFFFASGDSVQEVDADEVVKQESEMICHDYWLIAPALYKKTKLLPRRVIDVEELRISTSGLREDRENRDSRDVCSVLLEQDFLKEDVIRRYRNIVFKNALLDTATLCFVGEALLRLSEDVEAKAKSANEWERYSTIERPVSEYLLRSAARGIAINSTALRKHKDRIEFDYYMALKEFSAEYSLPLEIPSDDEVIEYLSPKGFDFSGVGVDYVLNFVPTTDGFSDRLLELRKIATSRTVLNAIPFSEKRIFPIVDHFGSITSRIYYKDPSLQNLAKRHRNIISADEGMKLSYVDFGQFEAGIMGALSGDQCMLDLFASGDLYSLVAEEIFSNTSKRKPAKRLFLSYAYGMKRKRLIDAAVEFGAQRDAAKAFFNQFSTFENWKSGVWTEFQSSGRIGTAFGNYLSRSGSDELSEKEKRSAVSQVVQGTASLIFKKALLKLSLLTNVELKVPMHDAVLFQHPENFDPVEVANMFAAVVTEHFDGKIAGKASVANFMHD